MEGKEIEKKKTIASKGDRRKMERYENAEMNLSFSYAHVQYRQPEIVDEWLLSLCKEKKKKKT